MSARQTKTCGAAPDIERQAERLLRALAEPGASAKPTDIRRPDLLAITARRKGVSFAAAHFPAAAGANLVAQDLARWSQAAGRPVLEMTEPGRAKVRREAAPALDKFQAQHREVEETLLEPHGPVKRNEAESPLAWLARRKDRDGRAMLDPASFAAGERFAPISRLPACSRASPWTGRIRSTVPRLVIAACISATSWSRRVSGLTQRSMRSGRSSARWSSTSAGF